MSSSAPDKSPLERLLDAGLYAPLGYVLRREEVKEDLAAAGRKQIAFARSLGRAALRTVGRGLRSEPNAGVSSAEPVHAERVADVPTESEPAPEPTAADEPTEAAEAATAADEPTEAATPADPASELAIDDYAALTAKELIARLSNASVDQAAWILDREQAGKKRVTVLRAAEARLGTDD